MVYFDSTGITPSSQSFQEKDACGVGFIYRKEASHACIFDAMEALAKVEHRGACAADGITGDGAGIMAEIPRTLLKDDGFDITESDAVGVVFLPRELTKQCKEVFEEIIISYGFSIKGWRSVPTRSEVLGPIAKMSYPSIQQVVLTPDTGISEDEAEIRLYIARQKITNSIYDEFHCEDDFYIASLSTRTIVYKALTSSLGLRHFYKDLTDERYHSRWAVFHRRFSTNTQSRWKLAQPFRFIAHNGEINTINGNINWLKARLSVQKNLSGEDETYRVNPDWAGSDSSVLDYALEMVLQEGDTPEAALMKLIPEAYENETYLKNHPEILHFYEYFASIQEPWDGPALIVYSDGKTLGATLDRNGLRPARYTLYEDGTVMLCSEAGMSVSNEGRVMERDRLGPGDMISLEIDSGIVRKNIEIKQRVAATQPYGQWLLQQRRALAESAMEEGETLEEKDILTLQRASGFGREDIEKTIAAMVLTEKEPILSMGDDTPLAVLSGKPRTIYDYFKQKFAQVTNPPIDPIRERVVMSLESHLGPKPKVLVPDSVSAQTLLLPSPVLNEGELAFIYTLDHPLKATRISTVFEESVGLKEAIEELCKHVREEVKFGCSIVVLSDRQANLRNPVIPPMMAAGAIHHDLIKHGLRLNTSIVLETAQCWTSHHMACLLAVGAQAVCPYLAFESVRHWYQSEKTAKNLEKANELDEKEIFGTLLEGYKNLDGAAALERYRVALEHGILKIISKMGVSKVSSYIGAQILECLGLGSEVIDLCFPGVHSPVGGLDFQEVQREIVRQFEGAAREDGKLADHGQLKNIPTGEYHRNNPELVKALHKALALKDKDVKEEEKKKQFEIYSSLVDSQPQTALRELLRIKSDREPISLSEVEPEEAILSRFLTGGMSLGALSKESHEALAIAMNRLGARSNSGEGGEDPLRNRPIRVKDDGTSDDFPGLKNLKEGDHALSKIRQVASGRFGVTPEYLVTAEQLEIKVAQGAKPGEGGQLPSHKVSEYIAGLRRTKPGVSLISPPPHHDIYSIEDLAQLIYDLKSVNTEADVSVKLVSEHGIGTIATGVAKANADIIHVSGHDGGTGAAPLSSIKNAGMPWELGLTETHSTLVERGLRNRVRLRVDGGIRTGLDIIKASMMGANEFAFGTIALLSQGCIMARVCHTNNCPVGIATQKEKLRERFSGDPQSVVDFFKFLAAEVRYLLANLGYSTLAELTGRVDLFEVADVTSVPKTKNLELENFFKPRGPSKFCGILEKPAEEPSLNERLATNQALLEAVANHGTSVQDWEIHNTDRTVGATLAGMIARKHGDHGFGGQIVLNFSGVAGQSFGAFNIQNVRLNLEGAANDYVGKGMSGGEITIRSNLGGDFSDVLVGNTALYGATGGRLFVQGRAGERFAVRNSRAVAVVEGTGDHTCEYMTGGLVLVLGKVGRNFGAGMTGGLALVLDEDGSFAARFGPDTDKVLMRLTRESEAEILNLLEDHRRLTNSKVAAQILESWQQVKEQFVLVVPQSELQSELASKSRPFAPVRPGTNEAVIGPIAGTA